MNLKRNLTGLLDFNGRQNREPFWIWVLICYGVQTAISAIGMIPFFVSLASHVQTLAARSPDATPLKPEDMLGDMQPLVFGMAIVGAVGGLVFLGLLAAAVVRRLHDRDLSGWWAAPPFALNLLSQASSISMMTSGKLNLVPDPRHPYANIAQGFGLIQFLSVSALIVLVVFLALPGTRGPNRYGPDPLFYP